MHSGMDENRLENGRNHQAVIDEQIDNLLSMGLNIKSLDYARNVLDHVSYYRLIKPYSKGEKDIYGNYKEGRSFSLLMERYKCDAELRHLLLSYIEQVEVALRCRIANVFSCKYGYYGYLDEDNFQFNERNERSFYQFFTELRKYLVENVSNDNQKNASQILKHFWKKDEGKVPLYAGLECIPFGTTVRFLQFMKTEDSKEVMKLYGTETLNLSVFKKWFLCINMLRNICAHYEKLFNCKLSIKPQMKKRVDTDIKDNSTVFAVLCCMRFLVTDVDKWVYLVHGLEDILFRYSSVVDKSSYGFIDGWDDRLLDQIKAETVDTDFLLRKSLGGAKRDFLHHRVEKVNGYMTAGDKVILDRMINEMSYEEISTVSRLLLRIDESGKTNE